MVDTQKILSIIYNIIGELDDVFKDDLEEAINIHNTILTERYKSYNIKLPECQKLLAYKVAFEFTGQNETTNSAARAIEQLLLLRDG